MSEIIKIVENVLKKLGSEDEITAIILLICVIVFFVVKLCHFWLNRKNYREEQQFETINRFVDEDGYLEKVKSKPHVIKNIVFSRIYCLRKFSLEEIEYLIEQKHLDYKIHELSELKSTSLLVFSNKKNRYILNDTKINLLWIKYYNICNFLWLLFFMICVITMIIIHVITQSNTLLLSSMIGLSVFQVWLMSKIPAVKTYIRIFGSKVG